MVGLRGRAAALAGAVVAAATVLVPLTAAPAHAGECRDNDGWWCLYADANLQGLLIGTNNPGADVELIGKYAQLNDRADSVINRTGSYMGLYEDAGFQKPLLCLPPHSSSNQIQHDVVTSIRMRAGRAAACGGSAPAKAPAPVTSPKRKQEEEAPVKKSKAPESPSAKPKDRSPSAPKPSASAPDVLPTAPNPTVALPELAGTHPAAPVSATSADDGRLGTGAVVAIGVGGGVIALLAGLAIAGLFRRRGAEPGGALAKGKEKAVRPGADPESTRRVDRAMRLLAVDCEQEGRKPPAVRAVLLEDTALTLVLAAPDGDAPQPWQAHGDRWTLAASDITELTDDVGPHRPFPLLVALRPGMWVNLAETPGPIALDGTRRNARRAVELLAGLLSGSPWSDGVRIRRVGFDGAAADVGDAEERGRVVFVDDGRAVPATVPAGCAVIAVGRVPGARTTWRVGSGGALVVPAVEAHPAEVPAAAGD